MGEKRPARRPRYQQIAVELAERIVDRRYQVGEKLHARSTLASNFNVSPETARKAINVLVDLDIMEVRHGSGAYVASREKAQQFLERYQDVQSIQSVKTAIQTSVSRQKDELNHFSQLLDQLVQQTKHVHNVTSFLPYELVLKPQAYHLGQTISSLNVWQETGATIIAIQHQGELVLSPGPYAVLTAGDTLYFVGNDYVLQRMTHFIYPNEN